MNISKFKYTTQNSKRSETTKYNLSSKNKMRHLRLILGAIKNKKLLVGAENSSGKLQCNNLVKTGRVLTSCNILH